jgi:DNA-binding transcriptional LysR family regulator
LDYLGGVQERFESARADLMLTVDTISEPGFVIRALAPVEMVLATHKDHPLASVKRALGRADFHKSVELLIAPVHARELPHIRKMFMDGPHVFELSDFYSKRQALLSGVGFGWMPRHLIADVLDDGELVALDFEEGSSHRLIPQLVHRRDVALGKAAEFFVELLEEEFARDSV